MNVIKLLINQREIEIVHVLCVLYLGTIGQNRWSVKCRPIAFSYGSMESVADPVLD